MPKNRRRNNRVGGKSIGIRTKNKIGGRKSSMGTSTMTDDELDEKLLSCRKRDKNKMRRAWKNRMKGPKSQLHISVGVLEVLAP